MYVLHRRGFLSKVPSIIYPDENGEALVHPLPSGNDPKEPEVFQIEDLSFLPTGEFTLKGQKKLETFASFNNRDDITTALLATRDLVKFADVFKLSHDNSFSPIFLEMSAVSLRYQSRGPNAETPAGVWHSCELRWISRVVILEDIGPPAPAPLLPQSAPASPATPAATTPEIQPVRRMPTHLVLYFGNDLARVMHLRLPQAEAAATHIVNALRRYDRPTVLIEYLPAPPPARIQLCLDPAPLAPSRPKSATPVSQGPEAPEAATPAGGAPAGPPEREGGFMGELVAEMRLFRFPTASGGPLKRRHLLVTSGGLLLEWDPLSRLVRSAHPVAALFSVIRHSGDPYRITLEFTNDRAACYTFAGGPTALPAPGPAPGLASPAAPGPIPPTATPTTATLPDSPVCPPAETTAGSTPTPVPAQTPPSVPSASPAPGARVGGGGGSFSSEREKLIAHLMAAYAEATRGRGELWVQYAAQSGSHYRCYSRTLALPAEVEDVCTRVLQASLAIAPPTATSSAPGARPQDLLFARPPPLVPPVAPRGCIPGQATPPPPADDQATPGPPQPQPQSMRCLPLGPGASWMEGCAFYCANVGLRGDGHATQPPRGLAAALCQLLADRNRSPAQVVALLQTVHRVLLARDAYEELPSQTGRRVLATLLHLARSHSDRPAAYAPPAILCPPPHPAPPRPAPPRAPPALLPWGSAAPPSEPDGVAWCATAVTAHGWGCGGICGVVWCSIAFNAALCLRACVQPPAEGLNLKSVLAVRVALLGETSLDDHCGDMSLTHPGNLHSLMDLAYCQAAPLGLAALTLIRGLLEVVSPSGLQAMQDGARESGFLLLLMLGALEAPHAPTRALSGRLVELLVARNTASVDVLFRLLPRALVAPVLAAAEAQPAARPKKERVPEPQAKRPRCRLAEQLWRDRAEPNLIWNGATRAELAGYLRATLAAIHQERARVTVSRRRRAREELSQAEAGRDPNRELAPSQALALLQSCLDQMGADGPPQESAPGSSPSPGLPIPGPASVSGGQDAECEGACECAGYRDGPTRRALRDGFFRLLLDVLSTSGANLVPMCREGVPQLLVVSLCHLLFRPDPPRPLLSASAGGDAPPSDQVIGIATGRSIVIWTRTVMREEGPPSETVFRLFELMVTLSPAKENGVHIAPLPLVRQIASAPAYFPTGLVLMLLQQNPPLYGRLYGTGLFHAVLWRAASRAAGCTAAMAALLARTHQRAWPWPPRPARGR
ncbi:hypothetical protein PAPYR_3003 [Paratrimastix pyriformis]|uniref:Uncharacterized protein n=1 Tax=Paratrimastix pyriformis TaxID=342808 RepID=A0ABQ8UNL2_9EUKA|nr:hypothetical protein PAPYR_3003 [Paratrimastix pyriformis]